MSALQTRSDFENEELTSLVRLRDRKSKTAWSGLALRPNFTEKGHRGKRLKGSKTGADERHEHARPPSGALASCFCTKKKKRVTCLPRDAHGAQP